MKHPVTRFFAISALALAAAACIHNDIPYPRIQANFLTFRAQGTKGAAAIDSLSRTVTLTFPEETDIYDVKIDGYSLTPGAYIYGNDTITSLDLSESRHVTLRLYQNYIWTIRGVQDIERYFTVDGQVGAATIDVPAQRVIVYVSESVDLSAVRVLTCKLGAIGSTTTPEIEGATVDLSKPLTVDVDRYGRRQTWTIYAEATASTVQTLSADGWTCVAWVSGAAQADRDNGVEFRKAGEQDWTQAPQEWVTHDGGSFTARLIHLEPETEYEARAYSDSDFGATLTFTTGSLLQMPNSDLDQWWLDGKVWCPWAEGGEPYWDSGNKGATTLGTSNTFPTEDTSTGTGLAAQLETRFVGIGIIGKLAAGNLFTGSYVRTDGTNGILHFGRPFAERPTRLRGYMKYKTAPISSTTAGFEELKDRPDTCIIWAALIDQDAPFEIRTNPSNRQLFSPDLPIVVAYGDIQCGKDIEQYVPFEVELEYKSTSRKPKYLIVTASASKYGDYFTGGNGATLWLDDLELLYDY
ncbi:MAG: PCMD domain-containing protein [Muribaculaceae bacterium]|nr:PCMD domain-containing protein [Muribaculaceae bacterium]